MLNLVFCFQVHQPYRLKQLSIFDVGQIDDPFDEGLNRSIVDRIAYKCYLPAGRLLLRLVERYEGRFRVAFSLTGTAIEQFRRYAPQVMETFTKLARTGCVEFLGGTYFHSLAFLFDREEFMEQANLHLSLLQSEFGATPSVFGNTELIYEDGLSDAVSPLRNYRVIIAEGAARILGRTSPLRPYGSENGLHLLLCRYSSASDDAAFRFSDRGRVEYPLAVDGFVRWVDRLARAESASGNLYLNLVVDYEDFGEHQWEGTGFFHFLESLPEKLFIRKGIDFAWPSDVIEGCDSPAERLSVPEPVSRAGTERDLSTWLSSEIQRNAAATLYELLGKVKRKGDAWLLGRLRRLSCADHLRYMSTEYFQDDDALGSLSPGGAPPYGSPESAYLHFLYALADIEERLS
jgi:alpha-amylase